MRCYRDLAASLSATDLELQALGWERRALVDELFRRLEAVPGIDYVPSGALTVEWLDAFEAMPMGSAEEIAERLFFGITGRRAEERDLFRVAGNWWRAERYVARGSWLAREQVSNFCELLWLSADLFAGFGCLHFRRAAVAWLELYWRMHRVRECEFRQ